VRPARAEDFKAVLAVWAQSRSAAAVTPDDEQVLTRLVARDPAALASRVSAIVADDEPEAAALWRALGYERDGHLSRFVRNL
jgi:hypothetical protein